ncbi:hypothetical protein KY334_04705 [Candidatus Woesearchaeota archaeon]|nr:hypothetical protein [Candidatus Woesearchaeota archaeon]
MTKESKKDSWISFFAGTATLLVIVNLLSYSVRDLVPRLYQDGIKNHLIHKGIKPTPNYPIYHEIFKTKEGEEVFTGYDLMNDELYIVTEKGLNGIVKDSVHVSDDGKFICDKVNSSLRVSPEGNRYRVLKIAYERAKEMNDYQEK